MTEITRLVTTLKRRFKAAGLSYREVAHALDLSVCTVIGEERDCTRAGDARVGAACVPEAQTDGGVNCRHEERLAAYA